MMKLGEVAYKDQNTNTESKTEDVNTKDENNSEENR